MIWVYSKVIQFHIYIYVHTHIYIHTYVFFYIRLLYDFEYSSLCYAVGPCLSILYTVVCMC